MVKGLLLANDLIAKGLYGGGPLTCLLRILYQKNWQPANSTVILIEFLSSLWVCPTYMGPEHALELYAVCVKEWAMCPKLNLHS